MDATLYDELQRVEQTHWWFRARRRIVSSLVERYLSPSAGQRLKICELGCGTGGNLIELLPKHDVIGFEYSEHALAHARQTLGERARWGKLPDQITAPPESFDVVLLTDVLEHVEEDAASAETALRLLRPGGLVIATVPAYQWLYSPRDAHHHHVRRYGKRQFTNLWKGKGAETLLISHYNTLLFAPAAALRMASKFIGGSESVGDLEVPPSLLNSLLTKIMSTESAVLGRLPMPCGLSLVAVVRKQSADERTTLAVA